MAYLLPLSPAQSFPSRTPNDASRSSAAWPGHRFARWQWSAAEMRVLVLNYEYPPLGGGAGFATAALAHGLAERGVTVDVVTGGVAQDAGRAMIVREEKPGSEGTLALYRVHSRRVGVHEAGMFG